LQAGTWLTKSVSAIPRPPGLPLLTFYSGDWVWTAVTSHVGRKIGYLVDISKTDGRSGATSTNCPKSGTCGSDRAAQRGAPMLFQELNRGNCKTYVIGCEKTRKAALIDPLRERVDRYLAFLAYHGYRLNSDRHAHHADHRTGTGDLRVDRRPHGDAERRPRQIDVHVATEPPAVGELGAAVLSTPGHSAGAISCTRRPRARRRQLSSTAPAGPTSRAGMRARNTTASTRSCFASPTRRCSFPGTTTGGTPSPPSARRSARIRASPAARARTTSA
jgi:hypothetical protein